MDKTAKIYVAGSDNYVGTALTAALVRQGYENIVGPPIVGQSDEEDRLADPHAVDAFFAGTAPDYVFIVAGESGGIAANQKYPAQLMLNNLQVAANLISSAHRFRVKKLLYLASSCVYPARSPQPIKEEYLLDGPLEATNEPYALAKIAGIKLCGAYSTQYGVDFRSVIPANIYGPGDDFSVEDSHVIPALIRKMHEAKLQKTEWVEIWGSGAPQREFIFVDDLSGACISLMNQHQGRWPMNAGSDEAVSIRELAGLIKEVVEYPGELRYDGSKPDGMSLKVLDSSNLKRLGWKPEITLRDGLSQTYQWFLGQPDKELSIGSGQR